MDNEYAINNYHVFIKKNDFSFSAIYYSDVICIALHCNSLASLRLKEVESALFESYLFSSFEYIGMQRFW